jgi:hypothetical protein
MLSRLLAARRATPALLRRTVDELPLHVRIAMFDGVRRDLIITGAYTDDRSGVCPMLAAHRRGARHSHPAFAEVWDAFAGAPRKGHKVADRVHVDRLADTLAASIEAELRRPVRSGPGPVGVVPRGLGRTDAIRSAPTGAPVVAPPAADRPRTPAGARRG